VLIEYIMRYTNTFYECMYVCMYSSAVAEKPRDVISITLKNSPLQSACGPETEPL